MKKYLLTISILLIINVLSAQNISSNNSKLDSVWQAINQIEKNFKDSANLTYFTREVWKGRKLIIKGYSIGGNQLFYEKIKYYKTGSVYRKLYFTNYVTIPNPRNPRLSGRKIVESSMFSMDEQIIFAKIFDKKQNKVINIRNNKLYDNQKYSSF